MGMAARVETVMASLPSLQISEKVATGEGGIIHGKRIKRFIDLSTTASRVAAKIAATLAKKNILQIDCPVSGGAHLYSHIDEGRVFPITYSVGDTLEGYKTLQKLASSRLLKLYPAVKRGLENWIVRLDVEPKV